MPTGQLKGILKHATSNKQLPAVPVQDPALVTDQNTNLYTPRNCPPYSPRSKFHPTAPDERRAIPVINNNAWLPRQEGNETAIYTNRLHSSPEQGPPLRYSQHLTVRATSKNREQDLSRYGRHTKQIIRTRAAQETSTNVRSDRVKKDTAYGRMSLSISSSSSHSVTRKGFCRPARASHTLAPVKALTIKKRACADDGRQKPQRDHVTPRPHLQRKKRVTKRGSTSEIDYDLVKQKMPNKSTDIRDMKSQVEAKKAKRKSRVYEEPGTIHHLPLVLSGGQDYECLVQWESEEEEVNNAEQLWRKLEQECGVASPLWNETNKGSRNHRGRWKVKVVETPNVRNAVNEGVEKRNSSNWGEEPLAIDGIVEHSIPFSGVLREAEDIIPSLSTYHHLTSTVTPRRKIRRRTTRPTRRQSRPTVHAHVKRILKAMWEELNGDEGEDLWCREMMRLHTLSRSHSRMTCSRGSTSDDRNQSLEVTATKSYNVGLGITMERSVTLKSTGAESLIDLYT